MKKRTGHFVLTQCFKPFRQLSCQLFSRLDGITLWACEQIGDLPWTEIDFSEDIVRAEREILPAIRAFESAA